MLWFAGIVIEDQALEDAKAASVVAERNSWLQQEVASTVAVAEDRVAVADSWVEMVVVVVALVVSERNSLDTPAVEDQ